MLKLFLVAKPKDFFCLNNVYPAITASLPFNNTTPLHSKPRTGNITTSTSQYHTHRQF